MMEVSSVGYKTVTRSVTLKKGKTLEENFELEEDAIALDGVVVSANRSETTRRLAPTLVNVVEDVYKRQAYALLFSLSWGGGTQSPSCYSFFRHLNRWYPAL